MEEYISELSHKVERKWKGPAEDEERKPRIIYGN
jgi:hypothetical protein